MIYSDDCSYLKKRHETENKIEKPKEISSLTKDERLNITFIEQTLMLWAPV